MRSLFIALGLCVSVVVALPAAANSTGAPQNRTGENGTAASASCLGCHVAGANPGTPPKVTVEVLPSTALVAGSCVEVGVVVHSH
ncbi:MAG: hypothetical protein ACK5ZS_01345, partial [bacterium]